MNELRQYTPLDRLILRLDERLFPKSRPKSRPNRTDARNNPAADMVSPLQEPAARVAAGLMRVNHAGEVCAQALYQGQALAARDPRVRERLQESAREEEDHLDWCRERLQELHAHASHLNPLWYLGSFSIGLLAGVAGDRWSLGFLAETEQQVTRHLQSHLQRLPEADTRSRAIIEQMIIDESRHADVAIEAGAASLPEPIRHLMAVGSKVMTGTAYYL